MVDWHTYKSTTNELVAVDAKLGGNSRLDLNSIGTTFFQVSVNEVLLIKVGVTQVYIFTTHHALHTLPNPTIAYHTIPYHTIPYHTIPYHTIPYHTIPY